MQDFELRQLLPGAPGIPAHMRVSHDARVFDELHQPEVTAAVYLPPWSPETVAAFNRLAQPSRAFTAQKEFDTAMTYIAGDEPDLQRLFNMLRRGNAEWLHPALADVSPDTSRIILNEVAERQAEFVDAASAAFGEPAVRTSFQVMDFMADCRNDLVFQPARAYACEAHTDPHNSGLIAHPVGTILVDQTGLDIPGLRKQFGDFHLLAAVHLSGRLWQAPAASLMMWKGEKSGNPQYHLIPPVSHNLRRARLFALT